MLDTVKTDLFAVNQMVATWDVQCAYEGQPSGNILQVACSERGNYFKDQYMCVQYPDLCNAAIIAAWWAPAQNEYVSLYRGASAKNKNGGGGFFHQVPACPDIFLHCLRPIRMVHACTSRDLLTWLLSLTWRGTMHADG